MKSILPLWGILLLTGNFCFAQTEIKNCNENFPLKNAIIHNAESGQWIGNTDIKGYILIPESIQKITISHPDLGSVILDHQNGTICIDTQSDILEELVIETGKNLKKELLDIFDHSYKVYKKSNRNKKYYQIEFKLAGKQEGTLETFKGILALGSLLTHRLTIIPFNGIKL